MINSVCLFTGLYIHSEHCPGTHFGCNTDHRLRVTSSEPAKALVHLSDAEVRSHYQEPSSTVAHYDRLRQEWNISRERDAIAH